MRGIKDFSKDLGHSRIYYLIYFYGFNKNNYGISEIYNKIYSMDQITY